MHEISSEKKLNPTQNKKPSVMKTQQYLQSLYDSYKRKSFLPSYEIKYEIGNSMITLGNIRQKLQIQKENIVHQLKEQSILSETISEQELVKYYCKKQQYTQNQVGIQILNKVKDIFGFIEAEFSSNQKLANYDSQKQTQVLMNEFSCFSKLFKLIQDFDNFFSQHSSILSKEQNNKKDVPNNFLVKIYQSIFNVVCSKSNQTYLEVGVQQILKKYNLPLKRNRNQKQIVQINLEPSEQTFLRHLLHKQACQYALWNFLGSMLNTENNFIYSSVFFGEFYKKVQNSIFYLFIQSHQSHNALEPSWMFEYVHETFNMNYQWLKNSILNSMNPDIQGNILIYVLQYSIQNLFYENIKKRFQVDLNDQENIKQPFFYYKFIDSLHELQQKLTITFSQQISLLQSLLLEFQIKREISILENNFDYEHKWIEQKIFKDFWDNVNYSHIDLKNIEAYNIVTNFNVLFEKLYSKFSSIYDQKLLSKINQFYQETVRNLAAHIKTSFERIFNHSGLDRLSIILAFKRVDNEFKAGLNAFIGKDLQFQKEIKKEYYDYIRSLFEEYAYEHVNLYHRKLLKITTENESIFTQTEINEESKARLTDKSFKVFKEWQNKLEELNKVYSYRDAKIKNQFFTFLESIDFSENGITLFLQFYEPFLKIYYSLEAYNVLKMVILMDKKEQLEYLKVHNNLLGFLLESQLTAIRKLKIR